jgi:hypothetical protein
LTALGNFTPYCSANAAMVVVLVDAGMGHAAGREDA